MKARCFRPVAILAMTFLLVFIALSSAAQAEEVGGAAVAETSVAVSVIVNIDKDSRTITLQDEESGVEWEFIAGPEVRNFDQLVRGDLVIMEYFAGLAIALEPKGSGLEERVTEVNLERAKEGDKPGMALTESTYVLAKVAAVDPERGTVTLQGPEASLTFKAGEEVDLNKVEVGQEVEVLYVQSYAISVEPAPKLSGTVKMKMTAVAVGIGVEWGSGTLTMYDGTSHEFKINGLTLLDIGASSIEATGEVYHLVQAKDLEGTYISGQAGAAFVAGGSALAVKNGNGVVMKIESAQKGVRLTLAAEGLKITLK